MTPDAGSNYSSSHRAYFMLKPDRPTDTGIQENCTDNEASTIYDLCGRKVTEITTPGIYIINGKRQFVR